MTHIHVIHENAAWLEPLARALDRQGLPWRDWFLDRGVFDLSRPPPEGVFYNRMSASSHTRDHRYAAELTASVLAWLERHGRRVVNGSRASRPRNQQGAPIRRARSRRHPHARHRAGRRQGPARRSRAAAISTAARSSSSRTAAARGSACGCSTPQRRSPIISTGPDYEPPVDGLHLLQQYVRAPTPLITRAEFIGGRFMYAVEVDTSDGFELCPADVCAVGDAFCPAGEEPRAKFTIIDDIDAGLKRRYEAFLAANDIERCRHRVHHRRRGHGLHLRRQHQHKLQPRRRGPRRALRHGHARPLSRRRARRRE